MLWGVFRSTASECDIMMHTKDKNAGEA